MSTEFAIALTPAEQKLLDCIELDERKINSYEADKKNGEAVLAFFELLHKRKAVPEVRLRYWNDPEYRSGRVKGSHKELFERNRTTGFDIYRHSHFLKHLRYFLHGADLPETAIAAFKEAVGDPIMVSSSDVVPLGRQARALARECRLEKHHAAEEFFKLALDLGLNLMVASSIRSAVAKMQ